VPAEFPAEWCRGWKVPAEFPPHRGSGLGPLLVRAANRAARELGYEEMWLDTLPTTTDAHRLYEKLGFREIPPYGSAVPGSRFYGLRLLD